MTTPSNLYANLVFSEHPISLYALDDDVSYISLISSEKRLFGSGGWQVNSASATVFDDSPDLPDVASPFNSDIYTAVIGAVPSFSGENIEWQSPNIFNLQDLNQELKTFSLSMYLYQDSVRVNWYEFGYIYGDGNEVVTRINAAPRKAWINFNFTYDPPNYSNSNVKIIIRANVSLDQFSQEGDYNFIVNGISVGQWSEKNSAKSFGVDITENIILGFDGVEAREYGIQEQSGYYISENNKLLAINDGLPLVYGSENCTNIYPSASATPSLIFPGKGILFESGKNKEYTVEFWMRINPETIESRRIFGPIDTDNGLYVRDSVISLVIGNSIGSHPISEWYRPMLVHIVLRENNASLILNGEQVFTINFDKNSTVFATENDFLGFYSYEDIVNFQIDCFSFYSYSVPEIIAKRRFVYGQGTNSPSTISSGFQGKNAYINFSNSDYTVNKSYPNTQNWSAGYSDNLISTRKSISSPDYSLPEIFIGGRDVQDLYQNNKIVNESENDLFFTFRPNQGTRTNLITNPSFETNTTGWLNAQNGGVSRSSAFFRTGLYSAETTMSSTTDSNIAYTTVTFPSAGTYRYSTYTYIPVGSSLAGRSINVAREGGTATITAESTTTLGTLVAGSWVRTVRSITCSSAGTAVMVHRISGTLSSAVGLKLYTDSVLCESGTLTLPYFDGSYSDPEAKAISTSWIGASNSSTSTMLYWTAEGTNWTEPGYLFIDSLSFIDNLSCIYSVFSVSSLDISAPLITIKNSSNSNIFEIYLEDDEVNYSFNGEVFQSEVLTENTFAVGIKIESLSNSSNFSIRKFFQSLNNLQVYIAGNGNETFSDKIKLIGLANKKNALDILDCFNDDGLVDSSKHQKLIDTYCAYKVIPLIRFNRFFLDISVYSTWEEYFPLSGFAGYSKDSTGKSIYDLDFLQINLGYPSLTEITSKLIENLGWQYFQLRDEYQEPVLKTYASLANQSLTGYENYEDLRDNNRIVEYFLDTEKSSLRSYVTFQLLSEGANEPIQNFVNTKSASEVIYAERENSSSTPFKSYLTKFEFADKAVIYPPKTIDFNDIAMVVHIEIKQEGILSNPIRIKDMSISSKVLSQYEFNPIGTESGIDLYPYIKDGLYYDYKEENPFLISKNRYPYLYLTQNSGIRLIDQQSLKKDYGIAFPINLERNGFSRIGAVQLWMKYDLASFPTIDYSIFEIQSLNKTIEFIIKKDASGKRAIIIPRDKETKITQSVPVFYQNGIRVKNPIIEINEWNSIGMLFEDPLVFDNYIGYINIFRGATFNNVSHYNYAGLNETTALVARTWGQVLNDEWPSQETNNVWEDWLYKDESQTEFDNWLSLYVVDSLQKVALTPEEIYKSFTGTNSIIVDDNTSLNIDANSLNIFSSSTRIVNDKIIIESPIKWQSFSGKPA